MAIKYIAGHEQIRKFLYTRQSTIAEFFLPCKI